MLAAWPFKPVSKAQAAPTVYLTKYDEFRLYESLGNVSALIIKPTVFNAKDSSAECST